MLVSQETGYAAPDYDDAQPAYGGDQDVYQVSGGHWADTGPFTDTIIQYTPSTLPQYWRPALPTHCLGASNFEKPILTRMYKYS